MSNYIEYGEILLSKKEYSKAIEYFQAAIESTESNKDAYLGLAEAFFSLRKDKPGKEAMFKALAIDPDDEKGLMMVQQHCFSKKSITEVTRPSVPDPLLSHTTRVSNSNITKSNDSIQYDSIGYNIISPKDNGSDFWRVDSSDGVMFYVGKNRWNCFITAPGKEVSYYRNQRIETPSWNGFKKPKGPTIKIPDEIEIDGEVCKITRLEKQCFYKCSSIRKIYLPLGLVSIDFFALKDTNIEMLDIPESVKYIDQYSFPRLNTLRLHGNPPQISVLKGIVDLATYVMIPREKKDLYDNAPYWQTMNLTTY